MARARAVRDRLAQRYDPSLILRTAAMQHLEDLQRWRAMSPAERARIGVDLTDLAWRFLLRLSAEESQRRLDLAREPWNTPDAGESDR
jgi:hypothetical protein